MVYVAFTFFLSLVHLQLTLSADRYWAICHSMSHLINRSRKDTKWIILACIVTGALVGFSFPVYFCIVNECQHSDEVLRRFLKLIFAWELSAIALTIYCNVSIIRFTARKVIFALNFAPLKEVFMAHFVLADERKQPNVLWFINRLDEDSIRSAEATLSHNCSDHRVFCVVLASKHHFDSRLRFCLIKCIAKETSPPFVWRRGVRASSFIFGILFDNHELGLGSSHLRMENHKHSNCNTQTDEM